MNPKTCHGCGQASGHDAMCFVDRDEEIERLRAALEEIADGVGCDSKYGPGCDTHCKTLARRALSPTSAIPEKP